jgi:hypothetical protein
VKVKRARARQGDCRILFVDQKRVKPHNVPKLSKHLELLRKTVVVFLSTFLY